MKGFVDAAVGFWADSRGDGVAYVRVGAAAGSPVLRVPFTVPRLPALLERELAYAAITAVASVLRSRGILRVRFLTEDARLVEDVTEHRDIPTPLTLLYVRLRCSLNQFRDFAIHVSDSPADLTARARSEVTMHVAA